MGRAQPAAILHGLVIAFETGEPLPYAEVCTIGADTTCVRADAKGRYRMRPVPGAVTVRFRSAALPPAVVPNVALVAGVPVHVSCAVSSRISLAEQSACLPVREP